MEREQSTISKAFMWIGVGVIIIAILLGLFFLWQNLKVYANQQTGLAKLAEARSSKQVQLEQAKANLESQKLNAKAEVERAKGAAAAIEIESGKLTENYIRYLWVQQQDNLGDKTVIYIPTENGLPITEANRLPKP